MKSKIIEIVELGQPKSLIQRENEPITELIDTNLLIEELNQALRLFAVSGSGLCEPSGYATTVELMMALGKSTDDALDIHNDIEDIVSDENN